MVLNGRLRSVVKRQNGKKELSREYGRHETVGQMEVLTETTRYDAFTRDCAVCSMCTGKPRSMPCATLRL